MTIDDNGILRDYTQQDINHSYAHDWSLVEPGATRPADGCWISARLSLMEALGLQRRAWDEQRIELDIAINSLDENVWTWDSRAQAERIYWHGNERRAGFDEI